MAIEITPVSGSAKFPRAYRARNAGNVVLFFSPREGVLIAQGSYNRRVGHYLNDWLSCEDNADFWEPVNLTITHD